MKTQFSLAVIFLTLISSSAYSQEVTRKERKEEKKVEIQKQTEAMLNAGEFIFRALIVLPSGGPSRNLTSLDYYVKFRPGMIESYLPFFGTAYAGIGYSSDTGLKFKGKPEKFTINKKAKMFHIDASVKTDSDYFSLSLSASAEGNAILTVSSNNRSTISYQGNIEEPAPEGKQ
jgi:hypothetical protein